MVRINGKTKEAKRQASKSQAFSKCPLQLETIERAITLWSNEGDKVLTPFLGIGSEVYTAIKLRRYGIGFELKESYFNEAVRNCKGIECNLNQKSLFD